MAAETFDRPAQDVGNIVALEHVNVTIPDQQVATAFYVVGLGFTRDPYLMVGLENMWINLGHQQFHLPTRNPQVLRGVIGVIVQDLGALEQRLKAVADRLAGTKFAYAAHPTHVDVTCPWGNRIRCHEATGERGAMKIGMPYVEFPVPPGAAEGVARFYRTIMGAGADVVTRDGATVAEVRVGARQALRFRETTEDPGPYDGHHVAIYISDFSRPYRQLMDRGLISMETNPYEWRFIDIVDPDSGKRLFQIEHEVRSVTHPMFRRPLVNRNPAQRQPTYVPGADPFQF